MKPMLIRFVGLSVGLVLVACQGCGTLSSGTVTRPTLRAAATVGLLGPLQMGGFVQGVARDLPLAGARYGLHRRSDARS